MLSAATGLLLNLEQTFEMIRIMEKLISILVLKQLSLFPYFHPAHLSYAQPVLQDNSHPNFDELEQVQYFVLACSDDDDAARASALKT